jgi:hypothetical protein
MLQQLISGLPQDAGRGWLAGALVCAAAGLVFWGVGARVGRSAFTLAGVAAGAWIGLRVPRWIGSEVEPMGLACAAALVLGLAGYLLHTVWVGLTLGGLFTAAGVALTWDKLAGGAAWSVPVLDPSAPAHEILRGVWASLPGGLPRIMPYVAMGCFAAGVLITVVWPKLGRVLAFGVLGSLMLAAGGAAAIAIARPAWLAYFPAGSGAQGVALAALMLAGAAAQWLMYPRPARPASAPPRPPAPRPLWRDVVRERERERERERNDRPAGAAGMRRGETVGGMKLTEARA